MPFVKTLRRIFNEMASPALPPAMTCTRAPARSRTSFSCSAPLPEASKGVRTRLSEMAPMMAVST
ncbi:hypothetical protein D3C72_2513080 [compost metagenome]